MVPHYFDHHDAGFQLDPMLHRTCPKSAVDAVRQAQFFFKQATVAELEIKICFHGPSLDESRYRIKDAWNYRAQNLLFKIVPKSPDTAHAWFLGIGIHMTSRSWPGTAALNNRSRSFRHLNRALGSFATAASCALSRTCKLAGSDYRRRERLDFVSPSARRPPGWSPTQHSNRTPLSC